MLLLALLFVLLAAGSALIGVGGGVVYVPTLALLGWPMGHAVPTSLACIVVGSLSASTVHVRRGNVDWKLAAVLEPTTMLFAFFGGALGHLVPDALLQILLGGSLVAAAHAMWKGRPMLRPGGQAHRWGTWVRRRHEGTYHVWLPAVLPAVAGVGLVSGMLGITGGFVKVPIMVLLCGVPIHLAVGTSTLMVVATGTAGLAGHLASAPLDWRPIVPLALAVLVGGQVGSRFSGKIRAEKLSRIFAVVLALVGVRLVLRPLLGI